jgi:hypothetical protein
VPEIAVTPALAYAMRTGASLMVGWTCLLVWASLRPIERRGVVLLTVFPVIAGLAATELLAVRTGFLPVPNAARLLAMQALLAAFGAWAWWRDGSGARRA